MPLRFLAPPALATAAFGVAYPALFLWSSAQRSAFELHSSLCGLTYAETYLAYTWYWWRVNEPQVQPALPEPRTPPNTLPQPVAIDTWERFLWFTESHAVVLAALSVVMSLALALIVVWPPLWYRRRVWPSRLARFQVWGVSALSLIIVGASVLMAATVR